MTVADDLSTERYASLFDFKPSTEHKIIFWPRDFSDLTEKELSQFDIIIHLAAKTNAAASLQNPEEIERVNINQTSSLIERATAAGVSLFMFPSSTSVYGVAKEIVVEDDPECINPQSPYAESKVKIERALQAGKMSYIIFRFGTIFGTSPGMRFHTAINKFCYQACVGEPLTVWRQNLNQKRPYLALTDAITAIDWAIGKGPEVKNEIYNVASGNYRLCEVLHIIGKHAQIEMNLIDTPLLNQYSYEVSCDKIAKLGYVLEGCLEDGIRQTMRLLSRIRRVN